MSYKYVYLFSEGNKDMRELLGGKGANLAEMTMAGMPVPQGFTISTEACTQYYKTGAKLTTRSRRRSMNIWAKWKRSAARNSPILRIRFWFPFVPAPVLPCPA